MVLGFNQRACLYPAYRRRRPVYGDLRNSAAPYLHHRLSQLHHHYGLDLSAASQKGVFVTGSNVTVQKCSLTMCAKMARTVPTSMLPASAFSRKIKTTSFRTTLWRTPIGEFLAMRWLVKPYPDSSRGNTVYNIGYDGIGYSHISV